MRCSRVSQGRTGPVNVTGRVPREADPETEVCLQDFTGRCSQISTVGA